MASGISDGTEFSPYSGEWGGLAVGNRRHEVGEDLEIERIRPRVVRDEALFQEFRPADEFTEVQKIKATRTGKQNLSAGPANSKRLPQAAIIHDRPGIDPPRRPSVRNFCG
jgi:hypothetical protein